jgi:putative addiction module component (TIGR02574 family)
MSFSNEFVNQALSIPATERFTLAQRLLDSIDDKESAHLDAEFLAELKRRRDEMIRG